MFKAWYPLTGRELEFEEVEVEFDLASGFSARLPVPGPEVAGRRHGTFSGRWTVGRGFVRTSVTLPGIR